MEPFLVKYYTNSELPQAYKDSILSGRLCYRNGEAVVFDDYLNKFFIKDVYNFKGLVICLQREEVVGFICFTILSKNYFSLDIFCRKEGKEYKNVSTILFNELKNIATKKNFLTIHLFSMNEFSKSAYEKLGFVSIEDSELDEMVYNIMPKEKSPAIIGSLEPVEKTQEAIKKDSARGLAEPTGNAEMESVLSNDIRKNTIPFPLASALQYTLL